MSLVPKAGGGDFDPAPVGMHVFTCVGVIDIGTQKDTWNGEEKQTPKVFLMFELDGTRNQQDDGPFVFNKEFSNYLSDSANLKLAIDAWFGKQLTPEAIDAGFHLGKLIGCCGMLNIIHKVSKRGRTYADMASITPMIKGTPKPIATTKPIAFDVDEPDLTIMPGIPKYIREKIEASPEWQAKQGPPDTTMPPNGQQHEPIAEDDIPF